MRRTLTGLTRMLLCSLLCPLLYSLVPLSAFAQQGHPLAGIWLGDWMPTATQSNAVVLELNWENTTLSGNINPGFPDAAVLDTGKLDSSNWTVHLEAVGNDDSGKPVRTVIDGKLDNLGSANRTLSGTWQQGTIKGTFNLKRE